LDADHGWLSICIITPYFDNIQNVRLLGMSNMEFLLLGLLAACVIGMAMLLWRRGRGQVEDPLTPLLERLHQQQQELAGRLAGLGDSQLQLQANLAERLSVQERELGRTLDEKLRNIDLKLAGGLQQSTQQTTTTLTEIRERLAVIDAALKPPDQSVGTGGQSARYSGQQTGARGVWVRCSWKIWSPCCCPPTPLAFRPPSVTGWATVRRVDCLLKLPNPPGSMAVDAKFPLESYQAMIAAREPAQQEAARKQFAAAVLTHAKNIADRYIVAGETADSAIMFLPSEAVYAELFASCPEVVEKC
jgi:DNA recombination protein RmuC